jgi:regulator of sigma E protease
VQPGKPAEGKLFPGDRIVAIDGKAIGDFPAQQSVVAQNAGKPLRVSVERDGKALDLRIIPAEESLEREFDIVERVGRLGVSPHFAAAVIGISDKESPAYRAGLRTFDKIISVNGRRVERFVDLMTVLASNRGDSVNLSYLRPVAARSEDSTLWDLAVYEPGVATLTPSAKLAGTTLSVEDGDSRAQDVMTRTGIESSEMYAAFVPQGSSEWQAGLRSGDRIFRLDGVVQRSWLALEDELRKGASRQRTLEWTRGGRPMAGTFQVRREQWEDDYGQHYERVVFRTTHWVPLAPDKLIAHPHPLFFAIRRAFQETANVLRFIGLGLWRALQGRLDFASVSGPITIYDIAGQAGARGPTHFVWAMAVVSVNLGLLNMLPIPVLDGGHMLFLGIEALGRKRVSKRIREMASLVGMGLLATMLLMAIANDVWRRWDVIVREAHRFLG